MNDFQDMVKDCKKIALLVPNFASYSGDARVVELQARELRDLGKDIDIITLHKEIDLDISIIEIGMPKSLFWQRIYRLIYPIDLIKTNKVLKILKEYDMIISHLYPMNWLASLVRRRYGIKYIHWYHGIPTPALQPYFYERIYLELFIWMTRLTIQNADLIVSVSKSARDELKDYMGLNSIVIYNKPDLSRFGEQIDRVNIRKKYNLHNAPIMLNVGRVCPPKGADHLVRAFNLVKESIPNVKLIIIGKPTYSYYMRKLKDMTDDSVIFAGFVPDEELPSYYAACDVYATCSLWETFNLPIAEAQACGKPVIAFDVGPHPEVIDNEGILVERENIDKFAEACVMKIRQICDKKNQESDT